MILTSPFALSVPEQRSLFPTAGYNVHKSLTGVLQLSAVGRRPARAFLSKSQGDAYLTRAHCRHHSLIRVD